MPRIPRGERLRRGAEIREVRARGACLRGRRLTVYVSEAPAYVIGTIAGRRVGLAVERNRARRLMREAMRQLRPRLRADRSSAILVSARPDIVSATMWDVLAELEALLSARGLLASEP